MTRKHVVPIVLATALLLAGCGNEEKGPLTEYVESIDAIFEKGRGQYEELIASPQAMVLIVGQGSHMGIDAGGLDLNDFTPHDLHIALERVAEIQAEAMAAAALIEPPPQIAEFHNLYFRELPIAELAARAGTAATWDELSASPEMAAYRTALAADNQVCAEFQARLDATAERGVFADVPWLPAEMGEIVDYALACDALPTNPEDAYRPPPADAP